MSKKKSKVNPRRIPMPANQARQAGHKQGLDVSMAIIFYALSESGLVTTEQLIQLWEDVGYVSDSIAKGYVNIADIKRVLRDEYGIHS